ncbi:MAG: nucleotide exchange factor GrpE, partial [Rhizobacter sp.]|nr:nucleotide exchange factor GrpE [Chlorobiales bacterium]
EMAQGDFTAELGLLDDGTPPQLFVQKHLIPHIDHIDHLFQPEPDATLQTPSVVSAYLRDLIEAAGLKEIDIKPRVSHFDIEKHEKAGALLRTGLEPNTVLKVLRRGFLYGNLVRKAQVVRAE